MLSCSGVESTASSASTSAATELDANALVAILPRRLGQLQAYDQSTRFLIEKGKEARLEGEKSQAGFANPANPVTRGKVDGMMLAARNVAFQWADEVIALADQYKTALDVDMAVGDREALILAIGELQALSKTSAKLLVTTLQYALGELRYGDAAFYGDGAGAEACSRMGEEISQKNLEVQQSLQRLDLAVKACTAR